MPASALRRLPNLIAPSAPSAAESLAPTRSLSAREQKILACVADVLVPQGQITPKAGPATILRFLTTIHELPKPMLQGLRGALWALETSTLPARRQLFSNLSHEAREEVIRSFNESSNQAARAFIRAILLPLRFAHFNDPAFFDRVNVTYQVPPPTVSTLERWHHQVTDGSKLDEDQELECEVVIIGTGAGGAPCAFELASRGRAVLMLEEGRYYDRRHYDGRPDRAFSKLYRDHGLTIALGNVGMPVWAGRAVGGSTAVNSGTCYRAPERTFARWRNRFGMTEFSSASMAPYYQRVEAMLGVAPAEDRLLGGVAKVISRGASRLGFKHGPLQRNAPGCDGAGVCAFGCPRGAKRSTDTSYVPEALKRGAQLVTSAKVQRIIIEDGRARGVVARLPSGKTLTVLADAVVVAGGALMTPVLLRQNGLCLRSGWLGKNLSVHPAGQVMALFDENIDMVNGIPQGYAIEEFAEEGLMLEGGAVPPPVAAMGIWSIGRDFVDVMDQYRNLAMFGFMIQDHSRGRVLPGPGGSPLIIYNMSAKDARRMQRGIEILCEVFLAAGAKRVLPYVHGQYEVRSARDLATLRERTLRPGDFEVTAYHPLGTARMGADPKRSVVGLDHQAHDVPGLFVVDSSAVPSSLGVNPQLTIMAMALRASELIDQQLD